MRILIADDHAIVRRGTRELLAEEFPAAEFIEVDTGEAAVARTEHFDLVVMDVGMPGRGGIAALKELHARDKHLAIVVLSLHAEPEYALRALRAGARGYVTKDAPLDELLRAVRAVLAGRKYVPATTVDELLGALTDDAEHPPHESLSDRELQVLRMLGKGLSLKTIARELALSETTASTYRRRVLDKLSLQTTAELIRYAVKSHLAD